MTWRECAFAELTLAELYELLQLRTQIFVVEQQCVFQDMDGKDQHARHLLGTREGGELIAYARLFGPGEYFEQASIGRVITALSARGTGAGRQLMREAISTVERRWGRVPIRIGAQAYLERFYGSFGFERDGDNYIEDGIPHLYMIRAATPD